MIRSMTRRWFLAGLLGIPASELGLQGPPPWSHRYRLPLNNDMMGFFEQEMEMRWHVYQASGPNFVSRRMDSWKEQLQEFVDATQTTPWHKRSLAVLSLSYQLEGSILRDSSLYTQAKKAMHNGFQAAYEAGNVELMASSRLRTGMVLMAQEQPVQAIKYFNSALDQVEGLSFPRLRGKLLQSRAEAYAFAQRPQDCLTNIGLASHILGREERSPERSHALFDNASVTLWKGLYALILHDYERAIILFDKGLMDSDPTLIVERARFLARKAEACYAAQHIQEAIETSQEAFTLASTLHKQSTIERVSKLHATLAQSRWRRELGVKSLGTRLHDYALAHRQAMS
ncbi:hypothetical protein EPA93_26295 [Ktedonosporobacter rubrisoli]|uniref:Tetratricopeptide repeat protein n=1 Tax=Ktedonosporobacter rubrisoli TaxID=2509675 RepID=A0A4P6JUJ4_KTERU|nr:hypothetical protein [Ktedonosporobacter rubrisoli]QBD79307.1 hypothetical protein EPA93_26295 [Ktedonosporobacter rubrisoli]